MPLPRDVKELFSLVDPDAPLQAGFLITEDGAILASWMRVEMHQREVAVMAATMMASIATIVEVFGVPTPRTVLVTMGEQQVLARKLARNQILILVSSKDVHKQNLYLTAKRLSTRLEAIYRHAGPEGLRDEDATQGRARARGD